MSANTNEETTRQLVVTKVADSLCGIEIEAVHEIILMQEITAVPKSPRNMLGMIDIRGTVLPVVDLRACLGFPPTANTQDTRIVLVSYQDWKIGLLVDSVAEVNTLPKEAFQSLNGNVGDSPYLRSVARLEDRLILNIDHVRVVDEGVETEASGMSLLDVLEGKLAEEEDTDDEAATPDEHDEEETVNKGEAADTTKSAGADKADEGGLNVELLESSFELLAPQGEQLVERFYERLFETAPVFRSLFPDDMERQKRALLGALGIIVDSLRAPEKLTAYLEGLGKHHVDYGAAPAHYDVVAEVLVATMAELAGDAWTDELQSAWTAALTAVKDLMLTGAETIEAAAA